MTGVGAVDGYAKKHPVVVRRRTKRHEERRRQSC
jgi:hypothetical protein